jgi:hypothetical protein
MAAKASSVLGIAVSSGKIGYVYFSGGELVDWGLSSIAARSPQAAQAKVRHWFETYMPDLIVTERLSPHTRKSGRTINNIHIIAKAAQLSDAHHIEVERIQTHSNKYVEAKALSETYTNIAPWTPQARKPWQSEPKTAVIFEALALVDQVKP